MTSTELSYLLAATIPDNEPVLIIGQPGCGKSAIVEQTATELGCDYISIAASLCDPTDAMGLPAIVDGRAEHLPIGYLRQLIDTGRKTVCLIDDLGQSEPAVQKSFMRLIHDRRVGNESVSPHVAFVAATNRVGDRAGVYAMLTPLLSRFATRVELMISARDWESWAWGAGIHQIIAGYVHTRPECLADFRADLAPMQAFCCPRTVHAASRLWALGIHGREALGGAIGDGRAVELLAYAAIAQSLPAAEEFISGRRKKLPDKIDARIAICSAVAAVAVIDNAAGVCDFMSSLPGELAAYTASCIIARTDDFARTPEFAAWARDNTRLL